MLAVELSIYRTGELLSNCGLKEKKSELPTHGLCENVVQYSKGDKTTKVECDNGFTEISSFPIATFPLFFFRQYIVNTEGCKGILFILLLISGTHS